MPRNCIRETPPKENDIFLWKMDPPHKERRSPENGPSSARPCCSSLKVNLLSWTPIGALFSTVSHVDAWRRSAGMSVSAQLCCFEGPWRCDVIGSKQDLASVCGGIFFWRAEDGEHRGFWASAPDEMIMANDVNNERVMLRSSFVINTWERPQKTHSALGIRCTVTGRCIVRL